MLYNFIILTFIVLVIWLVVLTIAFWKMLAYYNKLTKGLADQSLKSVLENLMKHANSAKNDIDHLKLYCDKMHRDGLLHMQKIGLLRFNPFKDTGGDQSFILSLTDANDTGVVISGLYSRTGTRWYTKKVINGKSVEHDLSEEEKKVLKEAGSPPIKSGAKEINYE
jgi:WD40 repeat protein